MIEAFKFHKSINSDLVNFISNKDNLYLTSNNKRQPIRTLGDLKQLFRESSYAIRKEEAGTTRALLFVWKATGVGVNRSYVKIEYETIADADDLLMVLNWNFPKEVYVKLEKQSPLINSFRKKGFKFYHDRDNEVLLLRSRNDRVFVPPIKEEDLDE